MSSYLSYRIPYDEAKLSETNECRDLDSIRQDMESIAIDCSNIKRNIATSLTSAELSNCIHEIWTFNPGCHHGESNKNHKTDQMSRRRQVANIQSKSQADTNNVLKPILIPTYNNHMTSNKLSPLQNFEETPVSLNLSKATKANNPRATTRINGKVASLQTERVLKEQKTAISQHSTQINILRKAIHGLVQKSKNSTTLPSHLDIGKTQSLAETQGKVTGSIYRVINVPHKKLCEDRSSTINKHLKMQKKIHLQPSVYVKEWTTSRRKQLLGRPNPTRSGVWNFESKHIPEKSISSKTEFIPAFLVDILADEVLNQKTLRFHHTNSSIEDNIEEDLQLLREILSLRVEEEDKTACMNNSRIKNTSRCVGKTKYLFQNTLVEARYTEKTSEERENETKNNIVSSSEANDILSDEFEDTDGGIMAENYIVVEAAAPTIWPIG